LAMALSKHKKMLPPHLQDHNYTVFGKTMLLLFSS
jgi:hypothetical protein